MSRHGEVGVIPARPAAARFAHARLMAALLSGIVAVACATAQRHDAPTTAQSPVESSPVRYAEADAIDSLLRALEARLDAMHDVAAAKWLAGTPVADPTREAAVISAVQEHAKTYGLNPLAAGALFQVEIDVAREVQQRDHDQWRRAGQCGPCSANPSLDVLRARIDAVTRQQLEALYTVLPRELSVDRRQHLEARLRQAIADKGLSGDRAAALLEALLGVQRLAQPSSLARVRETGILRIGTTGDYAPFSLALHDVLEGADVELSVALARQLGARPVFVKTSWPTLATDLEADRYDVALSGISETAARSAVGAFSRAYHEGGKTILSRCADRALYDSVAKVDRPGVRVVVNPGGTNEQFVREHAHAATILVHQDNRTIFEELLAHRADVMFTDDVEADLQALRHRGELCRSYKGTLTSGAKRIFMARDEALHTAVDGWLAQALAAGLPARSLDQAMQRYAAPDPKAATGP